MRFSEIKGLEEVKTKLATTVEKDQLPHAILLSGVKGSPNLPLALAFATYLNCEDREVNDACGKCPSCIKNTKYIHPDLNFVFPVTPQAGIKPKEVISRTFLKQWRQFLIEKPFADEDLWASYLGSEDKAFNISKEESRQIISNLSLKAFEGKYKIMLIWLPEYMNASAANGILKILEEPSDKTIFLLVSNDREQLLSTILSRVLTIHVPKFTNNEVSEILREETGLDAEKAERFARMSEGSISLARQLVENDSSDIGLDLRDWLLACHQFKRGEMVSFTDKFSSLNKLSQRSFLKYSNTLLREVLIHHCGATEVKRSQPSEEEFIRKLAPHLDEQRIEQLFNLLDETLYYLERNGNPRIGFMDLSVGVAKVFRK